MPLPPPRTKLAIAEPKGDPFARTPPRRRAANVPKQRAVASPPNPRKPPVVRGSGGALGDLFAMFPDLPRPLRPAPRVRTHSTRKLVRR